MRKKRELTASEIDEILSIKPEEINKKKMKDLFSARMGQDEPRFVTNDYFTLPANKHYNSSSIQTTVGRYIVNILMIPTAYKKKHGYYNDELTMGKIFALESKLKDMLLDDELDYDGYVDGYLVPGEWLALGSSPFLLPSMTYEMNQPIPDVIKLRDELTEKHKVAIEAGDSSVIGMIEDTLVKEAAKHLNDAGVPSYDFYKSGAFKFNNAYKKTSITNGSFVHPSTGKVVFATKNYMDGITKKDYTNMSNLTILSGFARGVDTQVGGTKTKRFNSAMQTMVLDEKGTDCGTKRGIEFKLLPDVKKLFINRYVIDGGKLVKLDNHNINSYVGKDIVLRSPMYCIAEQPCNICAGELFYKLGMKNVGLVTSRFTGAITNLSMKKMHDTTISFMDIDLDEFIREIK